MCLSGAWLCFKAKFLRTAGGRASTPDSSSSPVYTNETAIYVSVEWSEPVADFDAVSATAASAVVAATHADATTTANLLTAANFNYYEVGPPVKRCRIARISR